MKRSREPESQEASAAADADYEVGYGKPPLHTRFKKGESGNPGGRPKAAKDRLHSFDKILNRPIKVADNGRQRTMTVREALELKIIEAGAALPPLQMIKLLRTIDEMMERVHRRLGEEALEHIVDRMDEVVDGELIIASLRSLGVVKMQSGRLKLNPDLLYAYFGDKVDNCSDPNVLMVMGELRLLEAGDE